MSISLPQGDNPTLPPVPPQIKTESPQVYEYLLKLRGALGDFARGQFSNTFTVATAMNSGTSGTFVISSGGSIIVTSGIVIRVTS